MNKSVLVLLSVVIVSVGVWKFALISPEPPSILDLHSHFISMGHVLEEAELSPEEQEFVDRFRGDVEAGKQELIEKGIIKDASGEKQSDTLVIDGIKVKIESFVHLDLAFEDYTEAIELQSRREERFQKHGTPYAKKDTYINGLYVLTIRHYDSVIENGKLNLETIPLELDPTVVEKIVNTFIEY